VTPIAHLLSGYLAGEWVGRGLEGRRWRSVVGAGVLGGIAPDFDVALGLVGGWFGAGFHRTATHSLPGALVMGALAAAAARGERRRVFLACAAGVLTHISWDALNFFGVEPLWPWRRYLSWNIVHERDLTVTLIVALAAALVFRGRRRAALAALAVLLVGYLGVQLWWQKRGQELARVELAGRRVGVYPANRPGCGWIAVSAGAEDLQIHCVPRPWAGRLEPERTAPLLQNDFTRASQRSPSVRDFLAHSPFPFAVVEPEPGGGAVVIWRDLREAHQEKPAQRPYGIYVWVDGAGSIVKERHRWWLSLW